MHYMCCDAGNCSFLPLVFFFSIRFFRFRDAKIFLNASVTLLQRVIDVLMDWREYWIMPIVFPLSWLARMYTWLIRGTSRVTAKVHRERVARVAADIVEARARGATRLCSARPAKVSISTRVTGRFKRSCDGQIDVSHLDGIVEIDQVNGRMIVQPYVNMGTMADVLFPLGWTLPVMPEMEDLTIGSALLFAFFLGRAV